MQTLTVKCPECGLRLGDVAHPDVAYQRDADGNILCPNHPTVPMKPIGAGAVMQAEDAFKVANRELVAEAPLADAETIETLSKRLHKIEQARTRVVNARTSYDDKHGQAKDAKKRLDEETESFIALVGRLSAVAAPLPLFTKDAEQAAQEPSVLEQIDASRQPEAIYAALVEAGYLAVTQEQIACWPTVERDQAIGWARLGGTVETMPRFLRDYEEAAETVDDEAETTA